jgi:hypothetical protein
MSDMDDLLRGAVARKRARGGARLGFTPPPEPAPPPGPEPPPSADPPPPEPDPPRPAGKVPAGPRQPAPLPGGDFISQLIRRSRRYP